jgi:hypothetical protein
MINKLSNIEFEQNLSNRSSASKAHTHVIIHTDTHTHKRARDVKKHFYIFKGGGARGSVVG